MCDLRGVVAACWLPVVLYRWVVVQVFRSLFSCWCHNPVATLSLCLLAQAYRVSARLVDELAAVDITVGTYVPHPTSQP